MGSLAGKGYETAYGAYLPVDGVSFSHAHLHLLQSIEGVPVRTSREIANGRARRRLLALTCQRCRSD